MSRNVEIEVLSPSEKPFVPKEQSKLKSGLNKLRLPGCGVVLVCIAIAWGIEIVDHIPKLNFDVLGLRPRSLSGLLGIFTMPFLHGGFGHLFSNTLTFAVLAYLMLATEGTRFFKTTLAIMVLSGIGTWVIGAQNSIHIGASALIYGYFGYLVTRAFTEKRTLWTVFGVILCIFYGGLIFGIFPSLRKGISWEGHFSGFAAGIFLAYRRFKKPSNAPNLS